MLAEPPNAPSSPLARTTLTTLRTFFDSAGHKPGAAHWAALGDIATTLQQMADGTCPAKVLLSSIDPGVGKTQTVTHFARALVSDAAYQHVGMIICVGRLNEVRDLVSALGIVTDKLAVLTSDDELNALGRAGASHAQVLVTTQQRIEKECAGGSFTQASTFYYGGEARQVRVWDEAWMPGEGITLNRDALMQLVKPLRPISAALADAIDDFATDLRHVEEGALVAVPDFSIGTGASLSDILVAAAGITGRWRDDQQITVTSLVVMSGKVARVSKDGVAGSTLLTYKDTLPHDLAPLLVLDASGRVRQAYRHVQKRRGNLEFLKEAVKDYSPLTVRTWKTSGSKSGWMKNANSLTQGIIKAILERPDEQWLVVIHKAGGKVVDVDQAIRKGLPADTQQQVSTLTWGQHMATNLYADFPNVILAGTLFMAPSFYTALTHMAQDFDVADGQVSREDVEATMRGEHANLVLQALCRGRVRKSDGDRCQPMTAYVIASPRSGIPADLPTVFPGCKVETWSPFGSKLTGRALKAFQFVEDRLQAGADAILYREIANSVEMVPKDFPKFIAKTSAWLSAMDDIGMTEGVIQGRLRGLRRVAQSDLMKHEVAG